MLAQYVGLLAMLSWRMSAGTELLVFPSFEMANVAKMLLSVTIGVCVTAALAIKSLRHTPAALPLVIPLATLTASMGAYMAAWSVVRIFPSDSVILSSIAVIGLSILLITAGCWSWLRVLHSSQQ